MERVGADGKHIGRNEYRMHRWTEIIREYQESGLTVKESPLLKRHKPSIIVMISL